MDPEEELVHDDGQAHCPYEGFDWWVPAGMEYLYYDHYKDHVDD